MRKYLILFILPAFLLCLAGRDGYPAETEEKVPRLTLADCVLLALKNNYDVKKQYLGRIPQRYNLKVAEDKFNPKGSWVLSTNRASTYPDIETGRSTGATQSGGFMATMNVVTGGQFSFSWNKTASQTDVSQRYYYNPAWTLQFTQPLLKNAGIEVAMASVKIARIGDEQNLLSFRSSLVGIITSVITAYRSYISARWSLEISKKSLETAKQTNETTRAKIAAGRMAAMDIVETETNLANSELNLLTAENAVERARLTLIQILNIDKETVFEPTAEEAIYPAPPSLEEAISIAFQNRPDYLTTVRSVETAKLNLLLAQTNRLWDLSLSSALTSQANNTNPWRSSETAWSAGKSDWSVGLTLTIPFRDLTIEQTFLTNKIALEQSQIDLRKSRLTVEIELRNALRDVDMSLKQMKKAKQARERAQKKFEVENDKYKAGRSSNFQLVSYQNDLVTAQQNEVANLISYLNSLTTLDSALGTTLATWNIEIAKNTDEIKKVEKEKGQGRERP